MQAGQHNQSVASGGCSFRQAVFAAIQCQDMQRLLLNLVEQLCLSSFTSSCTMLAAHSGTAAGNSTVLYMQKAARMLLLQSQECLFFSFCSHMHAIATMARAHAAQAGASCVMSHVFVTNKLVLGFSESSGHQPVCQPCYGFCGVHCNRVCLI